VRLKTKTIYILTNLIFFTNLQENLVYTLSCVGKIHQLHWQKPKSTAAFLNKVINPEKEQPEWKTLSAPMKEINSRSPRDVMCVAGALLILSRC